MVYCKILNFQGSLWRVKHIKIYVLTPASCNIDKPTQYWHLIESWSNHSKEDASFTRRIQCGELIFWMAEVSKAVEYTELRKLKDLIINEYSDKRREGNRKIQEVCFDKIAKVVEEFDKDK